LIFFFTIACIFDSLDIIFVRSSSHNDFRDGLKHLITFVMYTKNDFTRLWTWADTLCETLFSGKNVGQFIECSDLIQTVTKGDIILVGEFDLAKRRKQQCSTLANINEVMTGRQWVLKCTAKEPDTMTDFYGIPTTAKRGKARFRIVQIEV